VAYRWHHCRRDNYWLGYLAGYYSPESLTRSMADKTGGADAPPIAIKQVE